MASTIKELFSKISESAISKLENEISSHFDDLADHVFNELSWDTKPSKDFFEDWRNKLQTLDSAEFFLSQFGNAPDYRVLDIPVKKAKQHDEYLSEVENALSSRGQGVVYITWRKSPEEVFYIGKAGYSDGVKRLVDSHHTSLRTSLQHASTLSLLTPTNESILYQLEASCIHLLRWYAPDNELFNKKSETSNLPKGQYSKRLDTFANRLEELTGRVRRMQWGLSISDLNNNEQTAKLES
ncbi:MAG: hypothetical protein FJX80_07580 [Bacteroidetes bacterium]|nr:hypothetical protein [Bacteroidota bacterium]